MTSLARRLAAEGVGTGLLVATVVGSGIMADRLTSDGALALLCNALPTGAMLVVLITILSPVSGAHLNPVVSLVSALSGNLGGRDAAFYAGAQVAGAMLGTGLAHAMFSLPLIELSTHARSGAGQWLGEFVATFGLVVVVVAAARLRLRAVAGMVGLFIAAAYWFTSSTSFANPAVTLGRALTDSVSGIEPSDVLPFMVAQIAGGLIAMLVASWLWRGVIRSDDAGGAGLV